MSCKATPPPVSSIVLSTGRELGRVLVSHEEVNFRGTSTNRRRGWFGVAGCEGARARGRCYGGDARLSRSESPVATAARLVRNSTVALSSIARLSGSTTTP
jgi:hypothetical protein